MKNLTPHPIGVVTDYSYGPEFDAAHYLKKIVTRDDLNLMQMFKFRRFDIGLGNRHVISYYAQQVGDTEGLVFLDPPLTRSPLYVAFSKTRGHEKLAAAFSRALRNFKKTREYHNILNSYGIEF